LSPECGKHTSPEIISIHVTDIWLKLRCKNVKRLMYGIFEDAFLLDASLNSANALKYVTL
jgi:hypothetical protein